MNPIVEYFLDKGFLISPKFLNSIPEEFNKDEFIALLNKKIKSKDEPLVINEDILVILKDFDKELNLNWNEFESSRVLFEKGRDKKTYSIFLDVLDFNIDNEKKEVLNDIYSEQPIETIEETPVYVDTGGNVIILKSYKEKNKKKEIQDFVLYFRNRYDKLKNMLKIRQELQSATSINRIIGRQSRDPVALIGLVNEKRTTKNGHIILNIEDLTGNINIMINTNKGELFETAKDLALDEVIGVLGIVNGDIVFVNDLLFPDIPMGNELKKAPEESYVVFSADLHAGNKLFYEEDFLEFIDWLNGKGRDKDTALKVKYLFLMGDVVDGVGIYPNQENDLNIRDIYKQYEKVAELLDKIRKDVKIIICAGNHDALRISEPQPILDKKIAAPLYKLPNVIMVTNPSIVNIESSPTFDGFNVLLYHGYSFAYYGDNVGSIRSAGGNTRADLIMKYILQRRHLAPAHGSNLYIPDSEEDPLIIDKIPDFFVTGHIHRMAEASYRNVSMIGCGCWIGQSAFQEKIGLVPEPSKINLVNLQTREMRIINFKK
jgi:DNA polymerase II small subunit